MGAETPVVSCETWEREIQAFDEDLAKRMAIIMRFECYRYTENLEKRLIRWALGYPHRNMKGRPVCFNALAQWHRRNHERLAANERERYRKIGYLEIRRYRSYSELKKYQDRYRAKKRLCTKNSTEMDIH